MLKSMGLFGGKKKSDNKSINNNEASNEVDLVAISTMSQANEALPEQALNGDAAYGQGDVFKKSNQSGQSEQQETSTPLNNGLSKNNDLADQLKVNEALREQALRSKMVSAAFGEMVSVLMRSDQYKHTSLIDLEWLVIPPLLRNQFLLLEARQKNPHQDQSERSSAVLAMGNLKRQENTSTDKLIDKKDQQAEAPEKTHPPVPVGLALWAYVSKDVDERLSSNLDQPIKLVPHEWKSGDIP